MPLVKPQAPPGFQSQATQVQATAAWYAGNLVRWRTGLLEKWVGWQRLFPSSFAATIRRMHAWLDLDNHRNLLAATDLGVQIGVDDTVYALGSQINVPGGYIVELGASGTTFSAVSGSTTVTVFTNVAGATVGGSFILELPISIGGRIIAAPAFFSIVGVSASGFTFNMPMAATVTETNVYGLRLLSNTSVNEMTVTWNAHGLVAGDRVTLAQTTTIRYGAPGAWEQVNFSVPAGTVVIVDSVPDANHFTFPMGALGTGDGSGTANHQVYEGCSSQHGTDGSFTTSLGVVIGIEVSQPLGNAQNQSWFLANLGQDGLAVASDGPLLVYHPPITAGAFLNPVGAGPPVTAPQHNKGMVVAMPQAQVILFGSEPIMGSGVIDPLLVRWSDAGTYNEYVATVSNQAGSFRLSRGSRIVGAIQAPQATLLFTDTDVWMMSYVGPPLVYGFTIMGAGCGLVAPHAVGVLGQMTVWQSTKGFWQFTGGAVAPLPCTVWDYIFNDIDDVNINKCHAASNSSTNEIAFYFPSLAMSLSPGGNLLLWSDNLQQSSAWALSGATAQLYALFAALYVYEPQYRLSGWFDDSAFAMISWWDRDLQGKVTTVIHAPDGSGNITDLRETVVNGMHFMYQTINKRSSRVTYTLSIFAHVNSTRNLTLRGATTAGYAYATFDVTKGIVVASGTSTPLFTLDAASVISNIISPNLEATGLGGNGWMRYVMTFTSEQAPQLQVAFNITNGTQLSYLGASSDCLLWGAQLVEGGDPLDYQPTGGTRAQNEPAHYVKFNPVEGNAWDSGALQRTAWLDNNVWGTPLGADANNLVQQHERGFDADTEPMMGVYAETGFTEIGDGTVMMMVDEVQPDFKWFGLNGGVQVTLIAANYAHGPRHGFGPYSMTPTRQFFSPRVRARYVALRYDWEPVRGFSARVGVPTYRIKSAGRRP
jgi:hypothetical protein